MIAQTQMNDPDLQRKINNPEFSVATDGAILYNGRLCVPNQRCSGNIRTCFK
ncbi:hypothetical protein A2U01_0090770, partial [Trifolium medium]|nr:hypothetical protein [Trifolium medium]